MFYWVWNVKLAFKIKGLVWNFNEFSTSTIVFCISCSITKIRIAQSLHDPPCPAVLATVIHSRVTEYPLPSWGSFWMRSNRTSRVWTPSWTCETLCRTVKGSPMSSLNSGYKHRTNWFNRIQTRVGIICHLLLTCIFKKNLFVLINLRPDFVMQVIPLLRFSFLPYYYFYPHWNWDRKASRAILMFVWNEYK